MEAYASCLPPGVVNFVSGAGRLTMGPIMRRAPDLLAFIGGSRAADALLKEHPFPHRLRIFLSLEGKNLGIVTEDASIAVAVEQCALGAVTYNGQRCTAIKMIFVHSSIAEEFSAKLAARISTFKIGLPWDPSVLITPLPEPGKPAFLRELISDATAKGAWVLNEGGGLLEGALMKPAVLYPVTKDMRVWHEVCIHTPALLPIHLDATFVDRVSAYRSSLAQWCPSRYMET
jgi:glyceraldehyde-3-phosphate dehydrogenase (NADP+)